MGGLELDQPEDAFGRLPEDAEMPVIAPVRLPPESERLAAVHAAPVMRQITALAEYCAAPGRTLTKKGNLQLADARHLIDSLDTGDDPDLGGYGKLRSSEELPELRPASRPTGPIRWVRSNRRRGGQPGRRAERVLPAVGSRALGECRCLESHCQPRHSPMVDGSAQPGLSFPRALASNSHHSAGTSRD
jgi:hypothetical protein